MALYTQLMRIPILLLALTLLACGGDEAQPHNVDSADPPPALDVGVDLGPQPPQDAAAEDAEVEDLGAEDAEVEDTGGEDAEVEDAGLDPADVALDALLDVASLTACADGVDNDDDGLIDLEDPACVDAARDDEADVCGAIEALNVSHQARVEGTTTEGGPSTMDACRHNEAPEAAFLFTLDRPAARLIFSTEGSAFDTLLSVRRDCADETSELACDDDAEGHAPARTSEVELLDAAPGHYAVVIDGFLEEQGPFVLTIHAELSPGDACPTPEDPPALTCPSGHRCLEGVCALAACANALDDDEDGRTDWPADPGCEAPEDHDELDPASLPECADGLDNDGDGLTDWPDDPDCEAASAPMERAPLQCADGLDNDEDGRVDMADPGCDGPEDNDEYELEACRDGRDNDDDGLRDYPEEPGCASPLDDDEEDPAPLPECADGVDNDGDGAVDWPDDLESCLFAAAPREDDPCEAAPLDVTGQPLARGTLVDEINRFQSTCAPNSGPDTRLIWRASEDRPLARLILDARATRSGVSLYGRPTCGGGEVACGPYFQVLDAGPIHAGEALNLFVDALTAQSAGAWQVRFEAHVALGGRCDGGAPWACALGTTCVEEEARAFCRAAACADGEDNDGDGWRDWPEDPGCASLDDADETTTFPLPACADGADNDGDGLIDFGEDPRCDAAADPSEAPECSDGVDNDGDGLIDFDRDDDGLPGVGDEPGCACAADELEAPQPACDDRCDNDHDGLIDLEDPGCRDDPDGGSEAHLPECVDGIDNDEDGRADYPQDPSCRFSHDPLEEALEAPPECADEVDNDEDGLIDRADPECPDAAGLSELGPCALAPPAAPVGIFEARTFGATSAHAGSCGGLGAPERVYAVEIPYPAAFSARVDHATFNALLYARAACAATLDDASTELGCARIGTSGALSFDWAGGPIVIFLDALNAQEGAFSLEIEGIYPEGGRCGPSLSEHARCADGLSCRPDDVAGFPTCQR